MNLNQVKKSKSFLSLFFASSLLINSACTNNNKAEDTKEVAEDFNDAKFDDTHMQDDAQFLVDAAEINLEQIDLAKLAQQNGTMIQVKEMGKMMQNRHGDLMSNLISVAAQKTIAIPTSATYDAKEEYNELSEKKGNSFDKGYCDLMVETHKDAIVKFEKASTESSSLEVKEYALASLPQLRLNLDGAITCQKICDKM